MTKRLPLWQRIIAYLVILLPFIMNIGGSVGYPVPVDVTIRLYVEIAFAVGAGLFIIRRSPADVLDWLGFLGWGGFCLLAVICALCSAR